MHTRSKGPATRTRPMLWVAALLLGVGTPLARAVTIDFEGVPAAYDYDGQGLNLGDYYASLPGGPLFGPQTTVLKVGGSLNDQDLPPSSGTGVLWGEFSPIQIRFSTAPATMVSVSYRSASDLFLYAFDATDVLIGSAAGPSSLAPENQAGSLLFDAGSFSIARVLIQDSGSAFVIDDFTYRVPGLAVPDSGSTFQLSALTLGALCLLRRPKKSGRTFSARAPGVAAKTGLVLAALPLLTIATAGASWVLSGNENKIDLTPGTATVIPHAPPDNLTLLDFSVFPPRTQHIPDLPNTVVGPPSNLAFTPDHRLALVANSLKIDPADPTRTLPDSIVHVVDLRADPPRRIGEVKVGRQPSGLSITPDGRHALVANRADGTVSLLGLAGTEVRLLQTLEVCPPEASLSDVAIHPTTGLILASVQKAGYLAILQLQDNRLTLTSRKLSVYGQPYRCLITPDGQLGLTAGQGFGNGPDADALTVIDLGSNPIRTLDYVTLSPVPESIDISPNGDWVAAVSMNGSNLPPGDPLHSPHGRLTLLSRQGTRITKVQETNVGRIPEGVVFTTDGRYLVVQCHPDRELWIFELRDGRLVDTTVRIPVPGMPSSLRAAPPRATR